MPKPATFNLGEDDETGAYRGDDYALNIPFEDENGDPIPLTGRSYQAMVRETPDNPTYWSFAIDHTNLADGYIILSLTGSQTAEMPEECWWDLEETIAGKKHTIMRGQFLVGRDITR